MSNITISESEAIGGTDDRCFCHSRVCISDDGTHHRYLYDSNGINFSGSVDETVKCLETSSGYEIDGLCKYQSCETCTGDICACQQYYQCILAPLVVISFSYLVGVPMILFGICNFYKRYKKEKARYKYYEETKEVIDVKAPTPWTNWGLGRDVAWPLLVGLASLIMGTVLGMWIFLAAW